MRKGSMILKHYQQSPSHTLQHQVICSKQITRCINKFSILSRNAPLLRSLGINMYLKAALALRDGVDM